MRVMALDLATKMGFCIGVAGEKARSGVHRLMDKDDDPQRGFRRLGIWLRDQFAFEIPDLVIVEAPVPIGAMIDWSDEGESRKPKFRSNPSTIYFLNGIVAVAHGICGPYGVRCEQAAVQTVRKHFLGVARPKDPKREVIARCHLLGLMDRDCRDDNIADAIALHDWACAHYARRAASEFKLFGAPA